MATKRKTKAAAKKPAAKKAVTKKVPLDRSEIMADAWARHKRSKRAAERHNDDNLLIPIGECISRAWKAARSKAERSYAKK